MQATSHNDTNENWGTAQSNWNQGNQGANEGAAPNWSANPNWGDVPNWGGNADAAPSPSGQVHDRRGFIVPFQPLTLTTLIEGTFAVFRLNPRLLLSIAIGIMSLLGIFAGLFSAVTGIYLFSDGLLIFSSPTDYGTEVAERYLNEYITEGYSFEIEMPNLNIAWAFFLALYLLLTLAANLFISGTIATIVSRSVIGQTNTFADVKTAFKSRFWALLGVTILSSLVPYLPLFVAQVIGIALVVANPSVSTVLLYVLFALSTIMLSLVLTLFCLFAPTISVIEEAGSFKAIRRSFQLVKGGFWRMLGRTLLLLLVMGAISSAISGVLMIPAMLGLLSAHPVALFFAAFIPTAVSGFTSSFSSCVMALMYIDERMRSEGLAPKLYEAFHRNYRKNPAVLH